MISTPKIEIRRATEADAKALTDLGRKTFIETFAKDNRQEDMDLYLAETFGEEKQLREICDPYRYIEMAWAGDQAAGFLHLMKSTPDPSVVGSSPIEILRLYVDARWHGKGIGPALMERCIEIAREKGHETLWLGVWERNFRARSFYEKFGFKRIGQHFFYLGKDEQLDWIMVLPV
jgi:ribosomal protein S18 acetylase RimI-like enzyme